ncbi:MAG: archease [Endomicrobium sp.]|jgi:SHS2 domain-containing protein|nr:archease [Endomicrobium sp.]
MKNYEFLEHTADFCLKVKSDTLGGLFEAAAQGLLSNVFEEISLGAKVEKISFSIMGESMEELLVKFLNELLYMFYIKKRLQRGEFDNITLDDCSLNVKADFVAIKDFKTNLEIKAVTYGNVKIEKKNNLYETVVIADV